MNIQARIQEAMRRRHKNEDGFTLIELLVVILIIAILAAVAIFALLSSLDTAKKSTAVTLLRSTRGDIAAIQGSNGSTDLSATSITPADLLAAEKDVTFVASGTAPTANKNVVQYGNQSATTISFAASTDKFCYQVNLNTATGTTYQKANGVCPAAMVAAVAASPTTKDEKIAWK